MRHRNRGIENLAAWSAVVLGLGIAGNALAGSVSGTLNDVDVTSRSRSGAKCDYWRLTIGVGGAAVLDLTSPDFDTYLYLYDANGSVIANDDDGGGGLNSRIACTLNAGEYLVEVTAYRSTARGAYALTSSRGTLSEYDGTDADDGRGDGHESGIQELREGTSEATLAPADRISALRPGRYADVWTFTLCARGDVDIAMTSTFDNYLILYAGNSPDDEREVTSNDDAAGRNARITSTLDAGTYCVEATSWRSGATGSYTLEASFQGGAGGDEGNGGSTGDQDDERNPGNRVAGALTSNDDVSRRRPNTKCDQWTLTIAESGTITIDLTSDEFDTYLYLLDRNENEMARDDDGGDAYNSRLVRGLNAGQYLIEVTAYNSAAGGSYSLTASQGSLAERGSDDGPDQGGDDGQDDGSQVSGVLSNDDVHSTWRSGAKCDYWWLTIDAGAATAIDLTSAGFDTFLYLCDASGNEIAHDDDSGDGFNSHIVRTLNAGSYLIEATAYSSSARGTYNLTTNNGVLYQGDRQDSGSGDGYSLRLDVPSLPPLTIGQPVTISGLVLRDGAPAANLSFGVHDGLAQVSRWLSADGQGRFSFTTTPRAVGGAAVEFLLDAQVIPIAYDVRDTNGRMAPVVHAIRLQNATDATYAAAVTSPFGNELLFTISPGETTEVVGASTRGFVLHPTVYGGYQTTVGAGAGGDIAAYVDSDGVGTVQITGGALLLRFSVYSTSELDYGVCWSPGGEIGAGAGVEIGADICLGSDGLNVGAGGAVGVVTSGFSIQVFEW